jgi:hypothetical protein
MKFPCEREIEKSSKSGLLFHLEMGLEQDITFSGGLALRFVPMKGAGPALSGLLPGYGWRGRGRFRRFPGGFR